MTFLTGPALTILFVLVLPIVGAYLAYEAAMLWERRE